MFRFNGQGRREFLRAAAALFVFPILLDGRGRFAIPQVKGQITAVTLIHGIPGREEDLKQHLLSLSAPTRAEPGCLLYDLYQSPERKHEFMRLEIWASVDHLEAHKRMPHLRASFEKRQQEGWTTEIMVFQKAE
jgi:quinol monooxygenase YgiN